MDSGAMIVAGQRGTPRRPLVRRCLLFQLLGRALHVHIAIFEVAQPVLEKAEEVRILTLCIHVAHVSARGRVRLLRGCQQLFESLKVPVLVLEKAQFGRKHLVQLGGGERSQLPANRTHAAVQRDEISFQLPRREAGRLADDFEYALLLGSGAEKGPDLLDSCGKHEKIAEVAHCRERRGVLRYGDEILGENYYGAGGLWTGGAGFRTTVSGSVGPAHVGPASCAAGAAIFLIVCVSCCYPRRRDKSLI
mmetsp:Transcript_21772/g.54882  ORF Transcript_21772/g.54882 Transcript_21772/m.54882 type:complete len:249 (-) Transcript_21772:2823-3569(-)